MVFKRATPGKAYRSTRPTSLAARPQNHRSPKLRDECLNREWFGSPQEAKPVIEKWRHFYNNERPH
ncbi:integrase core domain-containing protein [Rugamonas rubra]|uniref:integrase core domain-containing protein n=1 Tax=Rugamonas rubra TaxID=758825 RepID=UPI001584250F